MKPLIALAFLLFTVSLSADQRFDALPDLSRRWLDMRDIVAVIPQADTLDVYWMHTNELAQPFRSKLMRTVVSPSGHTRLSTVLVREFDESTFAAVDGDGANVQAIWTQDGSLLASPIVDGALQYPEGKVVTRWASYPRLDCHAAECMVLFYLAGSQMAAVLDGDSNLTAAPVVLPSGSYPLTARLTKAGILFARHHLSEARLALVRRDGNVQYDFPLVPANPLGFQAGPLPIAFNGAQHVVAFVDYAPEPDEVHIVTISPDGTMSVPVRVLIAPHKESIPAQLSLAWNGASYLLGGGYVQGAAFVMGLDEALRPLESLTQTVTDHAMPTIHAVGTGFVIAWSAPRPYITIVAADGTMSPALPVDPKPTRRRAVQ